MSRWLPLLLAALLTGCAGLSGGPNDEPPLLRDAAFGPPSAPVRPGDIFVLSPAMQRTLEAEILPAARVKGRRQALLDALYGDGRLHLEYDGADTRTAAEAFAAGRGNCLSLVLMTAAFAKALDVDVRFQTVFVEETWGRNADLYLSIGHVNLTLSRPKTDVRSGHSEPDLMMVDFLPPQDLRGVRTRAITEATVVAMYLNNRAVESLAAGRLADAYAYAREAIRQDPRFLAARNTLGAVYDRHGDLDAARATYAYVVEREPANAKALSNLAALLERMGRTAEAREVAARLARIEPDPPFSYYNRGLAAMREGDFATARDNFRKEIDRAAYYHEFHFWLAAALIQLGDIRGARKELAIAIETSATRREQELYEAKLARLRSDTSLH